MMTHAALKLTSQPSITLHKPHLNLVTKPQTLAAHAHNSCPKQVRVRGVILTVQGWNKLKTAKSQAEFQENAGDRFTLEELSERSELSLGTVSKILGRSEPVDRSSLQAVFQCFELELDKMDYVRPTSKKRTQPQSKIERDTTINLSSFCGRETELLTLQQWILAEHCRLLAIVGIAGSGKSSLAAKLASQIEPEFECVIWRSLKNAPSLEALLNDILPLLQTQKECSTHLTSLHRQTAKLIDCLQNSRCLIVLDDLESVLAGSEPNGQYRAEYEDYQ
ncbi:MAG TPA: NB-ARC domain-containing protein, partial [Leptolyngbya sp.]|nr:NB-ARC domain-containing protein [Leptolyngbya sp.]